jgi:hypothetical protein
MDMGSSPGGTRAVASDMATSAVDMVRSPLNRITFAPDTPARALNTVRLALDTRAVAAGWLPMAVTMAAVHGREADDSLRGTPFAGIGTS